MPVLSRVFGPARRRKKRHFELPGSLLCLTGRQLRLTCCCFWARSCSAELVPGQRAAMGKLNGCRGRIWISALWTIRAVDGVFLPSETVGF